MGHMQAMGFYKVPFITVIYGLLYNWFAVNDARNICSAGWHVPIAADWTTLYTYFGGFGGQATAGGKLKEIGFTYWDSPNTGATNEVAFNLRGAGSRNYTAGSFSLILRITRLWSADESSIDVNKGKLLSVVYNSAATTFPRALSYSSIDKNTGCSVRPIKDSTILTDGQTGIYTGNDGKIYRTICIGTQEWVADNIAETKYLNGDDIPEVIADAAWIGLATGAWCYYDNDPSYM